MISCFTSKSLESRGCVHLNAIPMHMIFLLSLGQTKCDALFLCFDLTGLRDVQRAGKVLLLGVSEAFLEEIRTGINRLSREDRPQLCT